MRLLEPPPQACPAPRPVLRALGRRAAARRARWPLWLSLGLHGALAGVAIALHVAPAPTTPQARPTDVGILAPELIEPDPEDTLPPDELPAEILELPPLDPNVTCTDPELCEPSLEPLDDLPPPELSPLPTLEVPTLAAARRRPPPPPAVVVATPPAPPAPPAPAPSVASHAPARAARRSPSPASAPNLPMNASLATLPRGLVVGLILTVEQDGRVTDVRVETSSGYATFDQAAQAWVQARWRFEAGPLRFRTRVPFHMPRR